MVVGSAVPVPSDVDYTLLERRLLPHCIRVCSLIRQHTPGYMSQLLDLPMINAFDRLAMLI